MIDFPKTFALFQTKTLVLFR